MDRSIDKTLIACLDALSRGESVDAILSRYPDQAVELRPLLETAVQLTRPRHQPTLAAVDKSRRKLLRQADILRHHKPRRLFSWRRTLSAIMPLLLLTLALSLFMFDLTSMSLPGEPLYGARIAIEQLRLSWVRDADSWDKLQQQFQQERISDVERLLVSGIQADVEFEGIITRIQGNSWIVASLPVQLHDDTLLTESFQAGDAVLVNGHTESGNLYADQITLIRAVSVTKTPVPTVMVTKRPLPAATPSPIPISTSLPTATNTLSPTATNTPLPTATNTPPPTATDTPPPTAINTMPPTPASTAVPPATHDGGHHHHDDGHHHHDNNDDHHHSGRN